MNIVILANPHSGRGRSIDTVESLTRELRAEGHRVLTADVTTPAGAGDLRETLVGADLLVCVGGDGTMHHALDECVEARVPIYVAPRGNENLFAREFGMTADPRRLLEAARRGLIREVDVGFVSNGGPPGSGRPFAIMCSFGPDAAIVHRVHRARQGPIGKLAYVWPGVVESLAPRLGPFTVRIDGRPVIESGRGVLLVANSRQYAVRLDPARRASMTDGLLDVVFMPAASALGVAFWGIEAALQQHMRDSRLVYEQGTRVEIEMPNATVPCQADGEALEFSNGMVTANGVHAESQGNARHERNGINGAHSREGNLDHSGSIARGANGIARRDATHAANGEAENGAADGYGGHGPQVSVIDGHPGRAVRSEAINGSAAEGHVGTPPPGAKTIAIRVLPRALRVLIPTSLR